MEPQSAIWPLQGLSYFIARPSLWARPILGTLLAYSLIMTIFTGTVWMMWPAEVTVEQAEDLGFVDSFLAFLSSCWEYIYTVGIGVVVAFVGWLIVLPLIMSFAYEHMVTRILRDHDVEFASETMLGSVISSGQVIVKTLHWRLMWPALSVISLIFFPPAGPLVSQLGLAHIASLDGCDLALSLRGVKGKQRAAIIAEKRGLIWSGVCVGAGVGFFLGLTIFGWVLFFPMMFSATALMVARWSIDPDSTADDDDDL